MLFLADGLADMQWSHVATGLTGSTCPREVLCNQRKDSVTGLSVCLAMYCTYSIVVLHSKKNCWKALHCEAFNHVLQQVQQ